MTGIKFYCVCRFCGEHSKQDDVVDKGTLEFNFRDGKIYFVCPKCEKIDELEMKPQNKAQPLPKTRRM